MTLLQALDKAHRILGNKKKVYKYKRDGDGYSFFYGSYFTCVYVSNNGSARIKGLEDFNDFTDIPGLTSKRKEPVLIG